MYLKGVRSQRHSGIEPRRGADRILLHVDRSDFEQSYEPGWELTPEGTIGMLITSLYPNPIVPNRLVTEELSTRAPSPVHVVNT